MVLEVGWVRLRCAPDVRWTAFASALVEFAYQIHIPLHSLACLCTSFYPCTYMWNLRAQTSTASVPLKTTRLVWRRNVQSALYDITHFRSFAETVGIPPNAHTSYVLKIHKHTHRHTPRHRPFNINIHTTCRSTWNPQSKRGQVRFLWSLCWIKWWCVSSVSSKNMCVVYVCVPLAFGADAQRRLNCW